MKLVQAIGVAGLAVWGWLCPMPDGWSLKAIPRKAVCGCQEWCRVAFRV